MEFIVEISIDFSIVGAACQDLGETVLTMPSATELNFPADIDYQKKCQLFKSNGISLWKMLALVVFDF